MKERPIIFSGKMVRAILEGRKTQTRRVVKESKENPYGEVDDRLWVQETWAHCRLGRDITDEYYSESVEIGYGDHFAYRADGEDDCFVGNWRSPNSMPCEASRILLEITEKRVERLQDISEEDAIAEGITGTHVVNDFIFRWDHIAKTGEKWADNPWVWVIGFRRVE